MKKTTWPLFLLIACSFLTLGSSCDPDEPQAPTKSEYLTSTSWKYESATYNGSPVPPSMVSCVVDNTLTFSGSTYTVNEGTEICSPSTATTSPQAWSFTDNETKLVLATTLVPGTTSGTFDLVTLNATNLVISQMVTVPPSPTPAPLVITFKH